VARLGSTEAVFPENLIKNLLPDTSLAYNPIGILNAYEYIRFLRAARTLHERPRSGRTRRQGAVARSSGLRVGHATTQLR
jgi:hypothetical protein